MHIIILGSDVPPTEIQERNYISYIVKILTFDSSHIFEWEEGIKCQNQKWAYRNLSLETVIYSKARHSFYSYTDLHPTQCKPSGCSPINKTIFAVSNGAYKTDILAQLLQVYVSLKKIIHYFNFPPTLIICWTFFYCRIPLFRLVSQTSWNHWRTPGYRQAAINMGPCHISKYMGRKLCIWEIVCNLYLCNL